MQLVLGVLQDPSARGPGGVMLGSQGLSTGAEEHGCSEDGGSPWAKEQKLGIPWRDILQEDGKVGVPHLVIQSNRRTFYMNMLQFLQNIPFQSVRSQCWSRG